MERSGKKIWGRGARSCHHGPWTFPYLGCRESRLRRHLSNIPHFHVLNPQKQGCKLSTINQWWTSYVFAYWGTVRTLFLYVSNVEKIILKLKKIVLITNFLLDEDDIDRTLIVKFA